MASSSSTSKFVSNHYRSKHRKNNVGHESIPANTVRYWLYPMVVKSRRGSPANPPPASSLGTPSSPMSSPVMSPSPAHAGPTKEDLSMYVMECLAKLNIYLSNYIWQSEPFNLRVVSSNHSMLPSSKSSQLPEFWIEGQTHYGDNIEDEWFIVFLLKQLTKSDPNLVVRVLDDDDFLLTEAADHLPRWLSQHPDSSRNRVFLYHGKVHIIQKRRDPIPHGVPSIIDALKAIRSTRYDTKATKEIQDIIDSRVKKYPSSIRKHQHKARVYIPAAVAAILSYDPLMITSAIRAFFYRDSIYDSKVIRVMKNFPPESRVMRNVTMTRCQYAQLMARDFVPDRKIGWNIPTATNSAQYRRFDLGAKIACGFEILVASAERAKDNDLRKFSEVRSVGDGDHDGSHDLDHDYRWRRFIQCLYLNGYFKDLVKGSREHNDRLKRAKRYFVNHVLDMTSGNQDISTDDMDGVTTGQVNFLSNIEMGLRVKKILKSIDVDFEKLKREEESLSPEDSDHWMRVTPRDLDQLLKEKFLSPPNPTLGDIHESVPKAISKFVDLESGIRGVEVPAPALLPTRPRSPPKTTQLKPTTIPNTSRPTTAQSNVSVTTSMRDRRSQSPFKDSETIDGFDPNPFVSALKSVLTLKVPSDPPSSSSDMSDYCDEDDSSTLSSSSSEDVPTHKQSDELKYLDNQRHVRSKTPSKRSEKSTGGDVGITSRPTSSIYDSDIREYMKEIYRELSSTAIGQSFEKLKSKIPPCPLAKMDDEDIEDGDIDIEYNTLKNMLQSVKEQKGLPGPSSTILNSMGVLVPSSRQNGNESSRH